MLTINIKQSCFLVLFSSLLISCSDKFTPQIINIPFDSTSVSAPDYSMEKYWAALPDKKDNADRVPSRSKMKDEQENAASDVFFIHPTTYLKLTFGNRQWNANPDDKALNKRTDASTILYQASIFNGAGRIYAPRYRQAHISVYFTNDHETAKKALDLAYSDIRNAFQYYLDHNNRGRPIIIASHSQGTTHAIRLMKEYFDGKPLMKQLVAAYLVGMPVHDSIYSNLKPCRTPDETGCLLSWRTYARDYFPPGYKKPEKYSVCTNPLTWTTDSIYASSGKNDGGVLKNFNRIIPGVCDAQVLDGVVRIGKLHFIGNFLFRFKNFHIVDYNLFYMNVRENAQLRAKRFLEKSIR